VKIIHKIGDEEVYLLHRAKSGKALLRLRGGWSPLPANGHRQPVLISCPRCSKVFKFNWADVYDRRSGVRSIVCPHPHCSRHLFCKINNFESAKPEPEFA